MEFNSKGLYQSLGKEKKSCCREFPSSINGEFRHFHVVVVQRRQRNVQKKRDARTKLLFRHSKPVAVPSSLVKLPKVADSQTLLTGVQ